MNQFLEKHHRESMLANRKQGSSMGSSRGMPRGAVRSPGLSFSCPHPVTFWIVMIFVAGCVGDPDLLDIQTTDGHSVQSLAKGVGERVVLIFDPAESLSCLNALAAWKHWGEGDDRSMVLLLTRQPTDSERRGLRLAGVREDGVLARPPNGVTPMQLLFLGDEPPRIAMRIQDETAFRTIAEITNTAPAIHTPSPQEPNP